MKELYEMIEKKIRKSGYPRPIVGIDVYDDICDQCLKITHSACHGTGIQKNIPDGENAVQSPGADHKVRSEIGNERKKKRSAHWLKSLFYHILILLLCLETVKRFPDVPSLERPI